MTRFIRNTNYHTLAGLESEIAELAAASSVPVETVELGRSTEGRPIKAICFGDGDFRKPEVLFFGLTHAVEFIGTETALSLIRHYSLGGGRDSLDLINAWVLPVLNPDGYAAVEKQLAAGLGLGFKRGNSRGVDLNRNFPTAFYHFPRSLFAGSPVKISPYYRGEAPCSESESSLFRDFVLSRNFKASIAFHSFGSAILFPYNHTPDKCRDHDAFMDIGSEMSKSQNAPYTVKPSYKMYSTNGSINDWMYDECGILAFLIEIGKLGVSPVRPETWVNPFYWYNPIDPREEIANVLPACFCLADTIRDNFAK
ncbi:MAG: M14 family zinc carboxypeptidase [bacterium]